MVEFWVSLSGKQYDANVGWACSALGIPGSKVSNFRMGGATVSMDEISTDNSYIRLIHAPPGEIPDAAAKISLGKKLVTIDAAIIVAIIGLLGTLGVPITTHILSLGKGNTAQVANAADMPIAASQAALPAQGTASTSVADPERSVVAAPKPQLTQQDSTSPDSLEPRAGITNSPQLAIVAKVPQAAPRDEIGRIKGTPYDTREWIPILELFTRAAGDRKFCQFNGTNGSHPMEVSMYTNCIFDSRQACESAPREEYQQCAGRPTKAFCFTHGAGRDAQAYCFPEYHACRNATIRNPRFSSPSECVEYSLM